MDVTADNENLGNAQGSAPYYRAAAARTKRLQAEATTPWIKQRLGKMVTWYEQLAEQVQGLSVVEGLDQIFPQARASQAKVRASSMRRSTAPRFGRSGYFRGN
jgi:hypothetical protein